MNLSDAKNEQALDILADIIEPVAEILGDAKVAELYKSGQPRTKLAKYIIKNHKSEIIEVMAGLDGVPVDEYECNVFTLPLKLIQLLNDKELLSFFTSTTLSEQTFSGAATGNIEESAQ